MSVKFDMIYSDRKIAKVYGNNAGVVYNVIRHGSTHNPSGICRKTIKDLSRICNLGRKAFLNARKILIDNSKIMTIDFAQQNRSLGYRIIDAAFMPSRDFQGSFRETCSIYKEKVYKKYNPIFLILNEDEICKKYFDKMDINHLKKVISLNKQASVIKQVIHDIDAYYSAGEFNEFKSIDLLKIISKFHSNKTNGYIKKKIINKKPLKPKNEINYLEKIDNVVSSLGIKEFLGGEFSLPGS